MKLIRLFASTGSAALAVAACPALAGEVTGTVIDETGTVALRSASVSIAELGREVATEGDGSYRIANVPAGTYTVEARYVGAPPETLTVTVPEEGVVVADFALGGAAANTILVIGQGANQANALSRKRASDVVSDVLTRDAIGQFPDQNVAESIRRLPGINVLNDQGEGRFVSVRGLDPNLNATSINGVRVPSPESDIRAVALDVVASDVIDTIEVKKSLTPDMDADTLGASIEISTGSALDRLRDHVSVTAEGSYNDLSEEFSPKGAVDFAVRLADNLGVSGGFSYYDRKYEADNIEADGWQDEDGLIYAEDVEYRDYDVTRERISASLGLDLRASDTTDLFVRGLFSQFDDQEYRRRTIFDFGEANVSGSGSSVVFDDERDPLDPEDEAAIAVERDVKDRFERQRIRTVSLGGETDTGTWRFNYLASWAKSSEEEDDSFDPTTFARDFEGDGLVVGFDYSDERRPFYSVSGIDDFFAPSTYELDSIEVTDISDAEDEEYAGKFDVAREFALENGTFTLQGGFKGRWREKTYNGDIDIYELADEAEFTLADVAGEQTYRLTDIEPVSTYTGPREFFAANPSFFERQEIDSAFDSAVEDYSIEEDIYAGYALGRYDSDTLTVIGGLRYERTYNDIRGNDVLLVEEGGTLPGGQQADDDTLIVGPARTTKRYNFFAPSLNVRFEPQPDLVFRVAGYRSIVRPGFAQLAPRFATERNEDDEVEGEFGNPSLLPYRAWNFDASAEYYLSGNGALTAAVFYKDIKDYIVDVEYEADGDRLVYRGIEFDEAVIPLNGDSAEVFGVELGFAQQWTMLPAPFDGLITQLNYTWTDATGGVPDGGVGTLGQVGETREIPLPSTSEHTFNAVLGYEKGPLSLRLAGTYRDDYLDELGGSPEEDRYVDSHFQMDLSARFRVTEQVQVFYEWINITDAEYFAYNNVGSRQNNYQFETYSWTMKGGVRVTF